jgi:hypothetical protein
MTNHLRAALARVLATLLVSVAAVPPAHAGQRPEEKALERAIKLLPDRPQVPIRLIDPELAPDPAALRPLDAFVVREPSGKLRQAVYLNSRSRIIENAVAGQNVDIAILAAVIRHELEHLRGGTELEARQVEMAFFRSLVRDGQVATNQGLAYLKQLKHHYRHQ